MARWDETREGQDLRTAWDRFRDLYQRWLPAHRAQLQWLAQRAIDR